MTESLNILLIFPESRDLIFIFAKNTPLSNLLGVLALILVAIGAVAAFLMIKKRMEKRDLMRDKILPELASKFGTNVSVSEFGKTPAIASAALCFERRGTIFDAKIVRRLGTKFLSAQTEYRAEFKLPDTQRHFFIKQKSSIKDYPSEWQPLPVPEMRKDFVCCSYDPEFLPRLLENEKIRAEILKYHNDGSTFETTFEFGAFIISAIWLSEDDIATEAARIEQVCRTAIVLHDELSKPEAI